MNLLTTTNLGKAIEIQALLAREGINAERKDEGSKSTVFLPEYAQSQRDRALLAIVKSVLWMEHVGLEVFDKGDFTSTKQDKKIRLARAINGELSRLIRRIPQSKMLLYLFLFLTKAYSLLCKNQLLQQYNLLSLAVSSLKETKSKLFKIYFLEVFRI